MPPILEITRMGSISSPADSLFIDIISIIRNSVNYIENSKATITF